MTWHKRIRRLPAISCFGALPFLLLPLQPVAAASTNLLAWNRETGTLSLTLDAKTVWRLNYGTNLSKPYFHPLALPGGPILTWDQPPDHPWHHGLWFSWKQINGLNFWESEAKTSHPKGVTRWSRPQIETRPDFSARIEMDLIYGAPNGADFVTENRVVEVSKPNGLNGYHLDWTMTFTSLGKDVLFERTAIPGEPGGQPWGGYAGLTVRLAEGIKDDRAITTHGEVVYHQGRYRGKAPAMDYTGVFEGAQAGIAILDFPGNINSPTPWYSMSTNSIHHFSPAVIMERPYRLKAGESFTLRYRVVVHRGRWEAEQLREAARMAGQSARVR